MLVRKESCGVHRKAAEHDAALIQCRRKGQKKQVSEILPDSAAAARDVDQDVTNVTVSVTSRTSKIDRDRGGNLSVS
jgi:hypothetical protein